MANRRQEEAAVRMFIESVRLERAVELVIVRDDPEEFPDFVLSSPADGDEIWVEVVEAVESGELIAAERRAQRLYEAAAREYRARGEEVVLEVSPQEVQWGSRVSSLFYSGSKLPSGRCARLDFEQRTSITSDNRARARIVPRRDAAGY
jgi:hypothetical protein